MFTSINRTHSSPHHKPRLPPSRKGFGGVHLQNLLRGEDVRSTKSQITAEEQEQKIAALMQVTPTPSQTSDPNPASTHLVRASHRSCHQGNVTPLSFQLSNTLKPYIQALHMQISASQRFVSHHEVAAASFNMSGDRPRFEGCPAKGSRPPCVKQSQGRKTEMSPSGLARPRSEVDRDASTFLVRF